MAEFDWTEKYEAVIGVEVHAELATRSKMFCSCAVVDATTAEPNIAVCPVCAGMPGVLPVVNQAAVELGVRLALALECEILPSSIFARKNYFYPDLPKGYQISQYEQPLARNGRLTILTSQGEKTVRIRRVHLEEDTGKLTHVTKDGENYSLIDLNRAGVPLLEIVTEPDLHSAEDVRAYAMALRNLLRYCEVNSGDMQKGVMRIEPNVSVRKRGSQQLGTRTEIKNLNSFRALERSVAYEIERQVKLLQAGQEVIQETRGWDEAQGKTVSQRSKEEAHDYRYFPEPDLPPLVIDPAWLEEIRLHLPELPVNRWRRFQSQYGLSAYDAEVLTNERIVADYFEQAVSQAPHLSPKTIANWICGEVFGLMNQAGTEFDPYLLPVDSLVELLSVLEEGAINQPTAKAILAELFGSDKRARQLIQEKGLQQVSDVNQIRQMVAQVLQENPEQVQTYLNGKETLQQWFFGQVMRLAAGKANPKVVQQVLQEHLDHLKTSAKR
ncbi:MAG: Asp-tRNA(Asn)/Glu-tRNA(Gln) amidotransferase GatCAB subunit B [Anaerolineae bacterium]|jgi:aspartyl-tRNA(Asn)/glutamyl-tRNA(Gln) amidotransferase subunit B|nr:MAG: Asp-tRNA(Asn)/Glu-tRNA(Gln) amidotransferase GatCAB subunit B [Anaerolineae bacterium]